MPSEQVVLFCENCKKSNIHIKQRPNHTFHLLMAIITAGIWIVVWLFKAIFTNTKPVCSKCGYDKNKS